MGSCVRDLAAATGLVESTVSHALGVLRSAGVVASRRDGRLALYSITDEEIRALVDATVGVMATPNAPGRSLSGTATGGRGPRPRERAARRTG
jgi:DNA-binding transcriptional ArsR family regulator